MNSNNKEINIQVNADGLDEIIEKANHFVELLREAQQIINSFNSNMIIKPVEIKCAGKTIAEINKAVLEVSSRPIKI